MSLSPAPESILSVGALTRLIKDTLGQAFPAVWVKGELSGFKRSDRGHLYFSMKEGTMALIDCVLWKTTAAWPSWPWSAPNAWWKWAKT